MLQTRVEQEAKVLGERLEAKSADVARVMQQLQQNVVLLETMKLREELSQSDQDRFVVSNRQLEDRLTGALDMVHELQGRLESGEEVRGKLEAAIVEVRKEGGGHCIA